MQKIEMNVWSWIKESVSVNNKKGAWSLVTLLFERTVALHIQFNKYWTEVGVHPVTKQRFFFQNMT